MRTARKTRETGDSTSEGGAQPEYITGRNYVRELRYIDFEVAMLTPTMAMNLLEHLYPGQRRVAPGHVSRLAADITAGRFRLSPDPVVITHTGLLVNGQHRLRACIQADMVIPVVLSRGWGEDVYEVMDAGLRRKLRDRVDQLWLKSKSALPAVRAAMNGPMAWSGARFPELAVVQTALDWEQPLTELLSMPFAGKLRSSLLGVCLRALIAGVPAARISRFVAVVGSGTGVGEEEGAATKLYAHVNSKGVRLMGGQAGNIDVYRRTQAALRAFLENRPITKLYAIEEDLWPIPQAAVATELAEGF